MNFASNFALQSGAAGQVGLIFGAESTDLHLLQHLNGKLHPFALLRNKNE